MTTATEHFEWCKMRAKEYIDHGDAQNAFSSFMSDMKNHEGTKDRIDPFLAFDGLLYEVPKGPAAVWRWIEGFPSP